MTIRLRSSSNTEIRIRPQLQTWPSLSDAGFGVHPEFGGIGVPVVQTNFTTTSSLPSWLSFSRSGNAMMTDSTGKLTFAPSNLLLNTATLSTQTVTTGIIPSCDVILSFKGTGSVAISGGYTGTLAGTGASTLVSLKFTTTTASLTFTVTGTVTEAQLERVTYETQPSLYVATTGSQYYGPRFDYDPSTVPATPRGLLIEGSRSNLVTYSDDLSNAAWTKDGLLAFGSGSTVNAAISPDGTQNADLITENTAASNHRVYRNPTLTAGASYSYSFYVKQANGNRNIFVILQNASDLLYLNLNLTTGALIDSGAGGTGTLSSATSTYVGNGWYLVKLCGVISTTQTSIFIQVSLKNNTTTGSALPSYTGDGVSGVYLWGAQLEAGSFATSYIPTTSASVTRAADVAQLTGSALTTVQTNTFTLGAQFLTPYGSSGTPRIIGFQNASTPIYVRDATSIGSYDITNGFVTANFGSGNVSSYVRGMSSSSSSGRSLAANGGIVGTAASIYSSSPTGVWVGSQNGSSNFANGWYSSLAIYNQRLPDAILKQKSVVGAPY